MPFSCMCSNYLGVKQTSQNKVVKLFFYSYMAFSLRCWGGLVMEGVWDVQKSPKKFLYIPQLIPNLWSQSDKLSQTRELQHGWKQRKDKDGESPGVTTSVPRSFTSQALPAGPRWQWQFPFWATLSCIEISIIYLNEPCCSPALQEGHSRAVLFCDVGHTSLGGNLGLWQTLKMSGFYRSWLQEPQRLLNA